MPINSKQNIFSNLCLCEDLMHSPEKILKQAPYLSLVCCNFLRVFTTPRHNQLYKSIASALDLL